VQRTAHVKTFSISLHNNQFMFFVSARFIAVILNEKCKKNFTSARSQRLNSFIYNSDRHVFFFLLGSTVEQFFAQTYLLNLNRISKIGGMVIDEDNMSHLNDKAIL